MVQRRRLVVEQSAAALSHHRASSGPCSGRASPAGALLQGSLSPDHVEQRLYYQPSPQLQQLHRQLAHGRLRVSLDFTEAVRAEESRDPYAVEEHHSFADRKIRAAACWDSEALQRSC